MPRSQAYFFSGGEEEGENRAWYTLIAHILKCPGIPRPPLLHCNIIWRSLVHSCFERRAVPGHSTIYEKSLCYQVFPFLAGWLACFLAGSQKTSAVLVVSPLIILMVDQVETLRKRGVKLVVISSQSGAVFLTSDSRLCTDSVFF